MLAFLINFYTQYKDGVDTNQNIDEYPYEIQIDLSEAVSGMILADNAITPECTIFMRVGSVLTESNFEKLKANKPEYILVIGDGAEIKLEELFKLTDGIMNKLSCKSNVLTFPAYIKDADEHTFTHSNNVALLCNLFSR